MKKTVIFLTLAIAIGWSQILNAKTQTGETKPRIEVCFVLDTTGSMGGLIEGAKQKIWSIANEMISAKPTPELKLGLIGYRDRGDEYVVKSFQLTDDIDSIYGHLRDFKAEGGGDEPESVNEALAEAIEKMPWSQSSEDYFFGRRCAATPGLCRWSEISRALPDRGKKGSDHQHRAMREHC